MQFKLKYIYNKNAAMKTWLRFCYDLNDKKLILKLFAYEGYEGSIWNVYSTWMVLLKSSWYGVYIYHVNSLYMGVII